jgi:DHA1 family bicyclomycin/chloramphenicol resistance-like MFS transporter
MGKKQLLLLLAMLTAFPPLSTDMYLPSIPILQKLWNQPLSMVNLSLVSFFLSYCVFILIYGPVSDRFGRKPPLLFGIIVYIIATLCCGLSTNVYMLIGFRFIQAAGAAGASALSMAITKDLFNGKDRARILAWIGVIMALAPMLAPVLGGWMLTFCSWRWTFVVQAGLGVIALIGVLRLPEPLKEKTGTGFVQTAAIYLQLFRNRRYIGFALMVSCVLLPHFAFIAGSADIYINRMGLSEQSFSYFFALNACGVMAGTFSGIPLLKRVSSRILMNYSYLGIFLGGVLMLTKVFPAPYALGLPMLLISYSLGLGRPSSNNMVLEQVDKHAGAASSLMIFIFFMVGAIAMWLISLDWNDKVMLIGLLATVSGGLVSVIWFLFAKKSESSAEAEF